MERFSVMKRLPVNHFVRPGKWIAIKGRGLDGNYHLSFSNREEAEGAAIYFRVMNHIPESDVRVSVTTFKNGFHYEVRQ